MPFNPRRPHVHLRIDGPALRLLRTPFVTTTDAGRAHRSRWTWGIRGDAYVLTPLSILNTLTGFYVVTKGDRP